MSKETMNKEQGIKSKEQGSPQPTTHNPQLTTANLNLLLGLLIFLGIFFRLFHFFDNRSLWIDELFLSNSIIRMNYVQLATLPLEYQQKAPTGFLWGVKTFVLLLGKKEMALRLFSLLAGIASLFIFLPVCRKFLKPVGVVVAMGILALAPPIIYHAVEVKQYSVELLATIIALKLYVTYSQDFDLKSLFWWGIYGSVLVWFSYSVIFILAGMSAGICLYYLVNKNWNRLLLSFIPGAVWLISFCINYYLFTYKHANSEWLITWFRLREGFMPFPPTSLQDIKWFPQTIYRMMDYPLGLLWNFNTLENPTLRVIFKMPFLSIAFLITGIACFFKRDKRSAMVLVFPLLFTLFASGVELYPFTQRLLVFSSPILILFVAKGCQYFVMRFYARSRWVLILPVLLLTGPLVTSAREVFDTNLFGGEKKDHFKEAYLFVNNRYKKGDVVYLYWNMEQSYKYYKDAYQLKYNAIIGSDMRLRSKNLKRYISNLQPEIKPLDGKKRVWLIYHRLMMTTIGDLDEDYTWYVQKDVTGGKIIHDQFNKMGREIIFYQQRGIHTGLFDLSD